MFKKIINSEVRLEGGGGGEIWYIRSWRATNGESCWERMQGILPAVE